MRFSSGWQGFFSEFPWGFALRMYLGAARQPLENPVHPSFFTQINPLCPLRVNTAKGTDVSDPGGYDNWQMTVHLTVHMSVNMTVHITVQYITVQYKSIQYRSTISIQTNCVNTEKKKYIYNTIFNKYFENNHE